MVRIIEPRLADDPIVQATVEELRAFMNQARQKRLVLDFAEVGGVGSAMLTALLTLQFSIEIAGGNLRLCKVAPQVRKVFAANSLDHMFRIEPGGDGSPQPAQH